MRVSEVYASVQGEGLNTGRTTVFVRFGGCNLRCPGWPCDTQHAINVAFRSEWAKEDPLSLSERVAEVADLAGAGLITLTGGEPFLQNVRELEEFTSALQDRGYDLEAFTNGTLVYPEWATRRISMIMDWKLPGSGEDHHNENRLLNVTALDLSGRQHAVKFVCKDEHDLEIAYSLWSVYLKDTPLRTYYGKVWDGDISDAELAESVMRMKLPWFMNVQLHNYIWDPQERGR